MAELSKGRHILEELAILERKIGELPAGYISRKTIKGRVRHYRQWREEGHLKSLYIKEGELEDIERKLNLRKELEKRREELWEEAMALFRERPLETRTYLVRFDPAFKGRPIVVPIDDHA